MAAASLPGSMKAMQVGRREGKVMMANNEKKQSSLAPSANARALLIGMLGPALQAMGAGWDVLEHGVLARDEIGELTLRHIMLGPAHLVIFAGFLISIVCIPLAMQVVLAEPEELDIPLFEPDGETVLTDVSLKSWR